VDGGREGDDGDTKNGARGSEGGKEAVKKLDVFMLTCAFVLVANVCYFEGKRSADKWYAKQPKITIVGAGSGGTDLHVIVEQDKVAIYGYPEPGKAIEWHHAKPKVKIINCDKALFCFNDGVPAKTSWTLYRVMVDYENHTVSSLCPEKELQIEPLPLFPNCWPDPNKPCVDSGVLN
jgi:hypothetical protein